MKLTDILKDKFLFFDGAMGTMLQKSGLNTGEIPDTYNITHPDVVEEIHKAYINAGSNIITTNTFGANRLKLKKSKYSVEEIISAGVKIAKKAADQRNDIFIALDISSIGELLAPIGTLTFDEAYDIFAEQVNAGSKAGADIILIETMTDIYEAKAAILAAKECSNLPVFCTMTFEQNGRTLTGTDPFTMVQILESLGVDALGVNCSLGPKELLPIVSEILSHSSVPVIVQPNAGLPELVNGEVTFNVLPRDFSDNIKIMAEKGASFFGGCCGTNPDYIRASIDVLKFMQPLMKTSKKITTVCSARNTIIMDDRITVIGERLNPTGKKKLKEALKNNDLSYVIQEALTQKEAGADVIDVNVGIPVIDEKEVMISVIKEVQGTVNIPLQIDSSDPVVLEAAVRVCNGKPIINSVNGKAEVMKSVFPIVKKYGTTVVGLTLDESGIPKTAEERLKIADKIIATAKTYGIDEEDIIIDTLVLTASAEQSEVLETIKAITLIKSKYKVKTSLGVSNVSFGLPERELLNRTFFTMALTSGLDAAIINPLSKDMMDTVNAFNVLSNKDLESKRYVEFYGNKVTETTIKAQETKDLKELIIKGLKEEAAQKTEDLLSSKNSLEIVDNYFIPALDVVGKKYETGEFFLPQLMKAAEAVKSSFEIIKNNMLKSGENKISKGRIIIATVEGDIHDIGKNIVKILLENYGFEVIDLGKDVPVNEVVNKVKEYDVKLVALSALMTTTVANMERTIKALRTNNLNCTVMVGGAVMTKEYADNIGADFYGKDALETVKFAQKFFNV